MDKMLLTGKWECSGRNRNGEEIAFPVTVPGTVHTGMIENGLLPDIFYNKNADDCMWIEHNKWVFTKEFEFDFTEETKKAEIEFKGLDTYCNVYLNGKKLGFCENMHLTYTLSVLEYLRRGKNVLKLEFLPPSEQEASAAYGIIDGAFASDRMFTRRMQCTYGWDWVPRLVTMGIWREVTLYVNRFVKIDCLRADLRGLNSYGASMEIYLRGTHDKKYFPDAFFRYFPHLAYSPMVRFTVKSPDGSVIYSHKKLFRESLELEYFTVENPKLWYPNGYGESPLYELSAVITDENDTVIDEKTVRFGIRNIEIIEIPDKEGNKSYETAVRCFNEFSKNNEPRENEFSSFEPVINNIRINCKGGNWVPADPFPGNVPHSKLESLIRLAHDAGINMLRVWGGGYYESDDFYDLCDKYGIMVQQDFMMACGTYPYDDDTLEEHAEERRHFVELFKEECEQNVMRLASHPSIVWYNGDNENQISQGENYINNSRRLSNEITLNVIRKYDSNRRFFSSTPWGGSGFNSPSKGLCHATGFLGYYIDYIRNENMEDYYDYFGAKITRFANETPVLSGASICSLKKFIPNDEMNVDSCESFEYHTKTHPYYKEFTFFDCIETAARKIFGEFRSAEDRMYKMNILGYEWVRSVMENFRRRPDFSSGNIFWMYNDCWPALGWSLVDYYGVPKAAYYSMARTSKSLTASVIKDKDKIKLFVSNDSQFDTEGEGKLYYVNSDEILKCISYDFTVHANTAECVKILDVTDDILVFDIKYENGTDRAFYLPALPGKLNLKKADIIMERKDESIILKSDKLALFVVLDGEFVFSENCLILLPGEEKSIGLKKTIDNSSEDISVFHL